MNQRLYYKFSIDVNDAFAIFLMVVDKAKSPKRK